jgi:hypothetical protein
MSIAAIEYRVTTQETIPRLLRAGLITGLVDGLWAIVLTLAYGRSIVRMFLGIAATPFGTGMFDGGAPTMALGVALHFCVALTWSAVFLLLVTSWPRLRSVLASRYGILKVASVYGPIIWIVMSVAVIPALTRQPVAITYRWWIQLVGHIVFVGLPLVWAIERPAPMARR